MTKNMVPSTNGTELPGPWAKTYAAKCKQDMLKAYSEWSSTYDEDSLEKFGYIAPKRAAQVVSAHIRNNNKLSGPSNYSETPTIADIGAGTGLVGKELQALGYDDNIIAVDYSQDMLNIAKTKNCYKQLCCVDLHDTPNQIQQQTGFAPGSIDVAVSVGTFTPNHVGIEALLNVIHFVRSGGLLCLALREDFVNDASNGFRSKLEELEASGKLKRLEVTEPELYTAKVSRTIFFRCWTFLVC